MSARPEDVKATAEVVLDEAMNYDRTVKQVEVIARALDAAFSSGEATERGKWLAAIKPHVDAITFADIQAMAQTGEVDRT